MVAGATPNSIIYWNVGHIEHPWFSDAKPVTQGGSLEDDGVSTKVTFVIYRGGIPDWCIYHSLDANLEPNDYLDGQIHLSWPEHTVASLGAKIHRIDQIKSLVECDDETLEMYRH